MQSKETEDFYEDLDLWHRVIYDCETMILSFSCGNFHFSKKVSYEQVIAHASFEMVDQNEQASWIEQVMIGVVVLSFSGACTEEFRQIGANYLNKLLAKENRPPDALEQINQWPTLKAYLDIPGVVIPQQTADFQTSNIMQSKEKNDFDEGIDLWNRLVNKCGGLILSYSRENLNFINKLNYEQVISCASFEMVDKIEQASWIEQVMTQVILLCYSGTCPEEFHHPFLKALNKLLAKENRPPDALEQISQWPTLNATLNSSLKKRGVLTIAQN